MSHRSESDWSELIWWMKVWWEESIFACRWVFWQSCLGILRWLSSHGYTCSCWTFFKRGNIFSVFYIRLYLQNHFSVFSPECCCIEILFLLVSLFSNQGTTILNKASATWATTTVWWYAWCYHFAYSHIVITEQYTAHRWRDVNDRRVCRYVALDAWSNRMFAVHSIILCFMCGPIGIMSHLVTKAAYQWRSQPAQTNPISGSAA